MNTNFIKTGFKKTILATACVAALSAPFAAQATNGYFAHGYGMKAKGMGGAGVAMSQDAMAAATNPAGMVSVGNRMDVGMEMFKPNRDAYQSNSWHNGDEASSFLVPEFAYNQMINDTMSWGVVVYGNGGMNTEFVDGPYAQVNDVGAHTGVDLAQLFIAPTFSMKIDDVHSVGISLNLAYQRFKAYGLGNFVGFKPVPDQAAGVAGLADQGYDASTGFGVKLGWTGKINDMVTLGATYQSRTRMSKFEKYNKLFAEQGDFDIPAHFAAGLTYKATPATTVALDVQRIQYSDIASIANKNNMVWNNTELGEDDGKGFGWEDITVVKLGVSHQYSKDLVLRAGLNHGDQPIPSTETNFNLIAPAVIEDHLTLGATWTLANGAELSGYYMHAFEGEVNGTGVGNGINLKMDQDALGVAYGWDF